MIVTSCRGGHVEATFLQLDRWNKMNLSSCPKTQITREISHQHVEQGSLCCCFYRHGCWRFLGGLKPPTIANVLHQSVDMEAPSSPSAAVDWWTHWDCSPAGRCGGATAAPGRDTRRPPRRSARVSARSSGSASPAEFGIYSAPAVDSVKSRCVVKKKKDLWWSCIDTNRTKWWTCTSGKITFSD